MSQNDETIDPRAFAEQKEALLDRLAEVGIGGVYEADFELPAEDTPLADVFAALKVVVQNLADLDRRLHDKVHEAEAKAATISKQQIEIRELSTPSLEIWDGIVVLPLIGVVDTARAAQIMGNLLASIVQSRATVAIIDITGVPVVDTRVASQFLKTFEAARLLGAEVVLSGISPQNAQMLVRLGVDLGGVTTVGSLKTALQLALGRAGARA